MGYKEDVHSRDVTCVYCGSEGSARNPLTVHHVQPRCQGGASSADNCILLCWLCHQDLHRQQGYPSGGKKEKEKKGKYHRHSWR